MSAPGQKRKSRTTILMSVIPPKAEVSLSRFDVRYVPLAEVAMPVEKPSKLSISDIRTPIQLYGFDPP